MMLRLLLATLTILILFCGAGIAQGLKQFLGKRVVRLEVVDENGSPANELNDKIAIKTGEDFSLPKIRDAINGLYKDGSASNVSVDAHGESDGVVIRFVIAPQQRVFNILFTGSVLPREELLAQLNNLDRGSRVNNRIIQDGVKAIKDFYQQRGYFEARVDPKITVDKTGSQATVDFAITPGVIAKVGAVDFTGGDLKLTPADLKKEMKSVTGSNYSLTVLQGDIDKIRTAYLKAGYLDVKISDPKIDYDATNKTVAIGLPISPGPMVTVKVVGFDLSDKAKKEVLPVLSEGGLDDFILEEGSTRLADAAQKKGYFFADIPAPAQTHPAPDKVEVTYTVNKGNRYNVKEVTLEGSPHLELSEINDQLHTHEAGLFLSHGVTSKDDLLRDSETIRRNLQAKGFLKAKVRERRLGVSPGSDDLHVTFVVEEGPQSFVGDIEIAGNAAVPNDQLLKLLSYKSGDPFSRQKINTGVDQILAKYGSEGYVSARVDIKQVPEPDNKFKIVYEITDGPKVVVNKIIIAGEQNTKTNIIRNYLRFHEGDVLKSEDMRLSEQDLYNTGVFRLVNITMQPVGEAVAGVERRDVTVQLERTKTKQFVYGGGYQSDDGPRGLLELTYNDFLNRLVSLSLRTRISPRDKTGEISYLDQRPFGERLPFQATFLVQRLSQVAFDTNRFTALAQVEKRIDDKTILFFRYDVEQVKIYNVRQASLLQFQDQSLRLGRLSVSFAHDSRDNAFDAKKGQYGTLDYSIVTHFLGASSNSQFTRFFGEYQRYFTLPFNNSLVFASDVRVGFANLLDGTTSLPVSERFFAGGSTTLRGFGFEEAGPRDLQISPVTGQPIIDPKTGLPETGPLGGNAEAIINEELRFPLLGRIGGAVFWDTGNVFARVQDMKLQNFSNTVGAGLRVNTPVGPVRVDLGVLVSKVPQGLRGWQIQFSFGQAF